VEKADAAQFVERLKCYGPEYVTCSGHTFFRLSRKQRELFNCDSIREILFNNIPVLVGIQHNGCYAAFYKHKNHRFIRIILDMKADRADVVTCYVIDEKLLPVIK